MMDTRDLHEINVNINGASSHWKVESRVTLADFIRHTLKLTGTHIGCEHGVCGACTVLFDGEAVRSCTMFAVQANGHTVITIEGLSQDDGSIHPVQIALKEHNGFQCGYCTPGMITTIVAFLKDNPNPTERDVREGISGNICRCTGYQNIVEAVLNLASKMESDKSSQ